MTDTKTMLGQIMSFAVEQCPWCNRYPPSGLGAYSVDKAWDGDKWVLLDSWEGHELAVRLNILNVDHSLSTWHEARRRQNSSC